MADTICLTKTHSIIILLVFMGLTLWYTELNKKPMIIKKVYSRGNPTNERIIKQGISRQNLEISSEKNNVLFSPQEISRQNLEISSEKNNVLFSPQEILEIRDRQVISDALKPPERRLPEHQYPNIDLRRQVNIKTRGEPDNYQLVGVVLRDNTESAYNLFGRQKYPGSNQYEYYVIGAEKNGLQVKIPITIRNEKEIEDNQEINIPGTNVIKGQFKVKLYNLDAPRYIPYA